MPSVTITITDDEGGASINVAADFGEAIDDTSQAHGIGQQLLQAVLVSARTYTTIEDTVPDVNVEPGRIITPTPTN